MQYNALQTIQAFEAGQGQRKERERERTMQGVGNALASGNYAGGAGLMFNMGDIQGGLKVAEYGKGLEDAEAEKKRVGAIRYGMSLFNTPEGPQREAMRGQIGQTLAGLGWQLDDNAIASMDLSDAGIKATLSALQDTDSLMAQYQGMMNPEFKVVGDSLLKIQGSEVSPAYTAPAKPVTPGSDIGKLAADLQSGLITQEQFDAEVARMNAPRAPLAAVYTGSNGAQVGTIPQGYALVPDPSNPSGYRMEAVPGGPAGTEAQGAAVARKSLENTFRTLFLNYKDLQGKGAIRDNQAGLGENVSAYIQSSPLGREVGKMVGSEAEGMRETIEALQPAISQAIMSQPGMSARSMDSERELQFFIRSITAPTADVQANYATLHALDMRFGSGQLMNSLLQSGEITPDEYNRITRSPRVSQITSAMDQKISELFTSEQGMADQITPEEEAELEELRRWKKDRGIP
jgi:hypothetical protein